MSRLFRRRPENGMTTRETIIFDLFVLTVFTAGFIYLYIHLGIGSKAEVKGRRVDAREEFWRKEILPLQEMLGSASFPIDCINRRMVVLTTALKREFGSPPSVAPLAEYNPLNEKISASGSLYKGSPLVKIYIPSLKDTYDEMKDTSPDWHEAFRIHFAVGLLHEIESFSCPGRDAISFDGLVENEEVAWANTCRYVLVPLHDEGRPLSKLIETFYEKWLECGATTNAAWHGFIAEQYRSFRHPLDQPK
ncbi:MAG: hypothetical protein QOG91_327 [Candidatus Parcubacteria bacterium]|nr:hypothetical protein [Candidatus Parcubacteria bacterium]